MCTTRCIWALIAVLLFAGAMASCGAPSGAALEAQDVWARPAMAAGSEGESAHSSGGMEQGMAQGMAGTGAVFMKLVNRGREADRLIGATTDAAQVVEIHETVVENEVMKMRMLPDGLEVPSRGEVLLKPGGYHVMLIDIAKPLAAGDRIPVTLTVVEKDGRRSTIPVTAEVRSGAPAQAPHKH